MLFQHRIALGLIRPLALRMFNGGFPMVRLRVVLRVLRDLLVVLRRRINVFSRSIRLLGLLLMRLIRRPMVLLFMTQLVVLCPLSIRHVMGRRRAAFRLRDPGLQRVRGYFFRVFRLRVFRSTGGELEAHFRLVRRFRRQRLRNHLFHYNFLALSLLRRLVRPLRNGAASLRPFLGPFSDDLRIYPTDGLRIAYDILLLIHVPFCNGGVRRHTSILFLQHSGSIIRHVIIRLLT